MAVNCVAALTKDDVTVANALEIFEENKHSKVEYWGFKDVGISMDDGAALARAMKNAGKKVVYEPLVTNESEALEAARFTIDIQADYALGTYFKSVSDLLNKHNIKYFPPFGKRTAEQRIYGSYEELLQQASEMFAQGCYGVRLSVYRYLDGDPEAMGRSVIERINAMGKPFMITGSINSFDRLRFLKEMKPWGFTIGGALFDESGVGGGTVAERLDRIYDYLHS